MPPSLLLIQNAASARAWAWQNWLKPLIIRVDYSVRPRQKILGGIAVERRDTLDKLCDWLFRQSYYPLIHAYLDRFANVYSAGALITRENAQSSIEVVGTGFDASDLRLGSSRPHETFDVDLRNGHILNHRVASPDQYSSSREKRLQTVACLQAYTRFVNSTGYLLSDLGKMKTTAEELSRAAGLVPSTYVQLSEAGRNDLIQACHRLRDEVVPFLPEARTYAASLSYFADSGWVLWDVYGEWYVR